MNRLAGTVAGRWATAACSAFAAGSAVGCLRLGAPMPVLFATLAAGGALLGAFLLTRRPAAAGLAIVLLVGAGGLARGEGATAPDRSQLSGHLGGRQVVVRGTVRDATGSAGVIVDATHLTESDGDGSVYGGLLVTGRSLPTVLPGDRVEVSGSGLRRPGARPGPASEAVLEREGVQAVITSAQLSVLARGGPSPGRAAAWMQTQLVHGVDAAIPEPAAALTLGIAFGIRQPLAAGVRAPLQDAGLIHIVVVSGLKVVILLGLLGGVAARRGWSRRRTILTALPLVTGYVVLSGAGPAAIRSALMASAALLARAGGRSTDPLPMLALCAAVMLGANPRLGQDVGFQLSFLGTLGIVVLASRLAVRIPGPRALVEPFAVTVAAQAATVPVMAGTFGVLSLVGPIANALVLPVLPVLIVLGGGAALLSLLSPLLAWLPLHVAAVGADAIVLVSRLLTALPGAAVHLGAWPPQWTLAECAAVVGGIAALVAVARARRRLAGWQPLGAVAATAAVLACALVSSAGDGRFHVTVLQVGAAPAVLVRSEGAGTALVDGGANPSALTAALGRELLPTDNHLDLVVLTGGEPAAVAGLSALAGRYQVGAVVVPVELGAGAAGEVDALQQAGATVLRAATAWTWGGSEWSCLPYRAAAGGRAMCALRVRDAGGGALLLGDAAVPDQEQLAAMYGNSLGADLLVTAPGGAVSPVLLAAAHPRRIAVPSAGGSGRTALASMGASLTGIDGDLRFVGGPAGLDDDR